MYDKCYFCLDQLPKLKKRIHSKLFRKFWRNRGTKEPAYITVLGVRLGSAKGLYAFMYSKRPLYI